MASRKHGILYVGMTNDLVRRAYEHRTNAARGFTSRYHVHLLVWFECYDDALTAIIREKEIKKMASGMEGKFNRANQSRVGRSV
jgi:putative endonuclease